MIRWDLPKRAMNRADDAYRRIVIHIFNLDVIVTTIVKPVSLPDKFFLYLCLSRKSMRPMCILSLITEIRGIAR